MFKKIISLMLIVCIMVNINTICFAQDLSDTDNLNFISNINEVNKALNSSTIDNFENYKVKYNYNITDIEDDTNVNVTICGSIYNDSNEYNFNASGEIPVVDLSDGSQFMEGPINGQMNINDVIHDITIGFRNIKDTNKVSAGLTIYPNENNPNFKEIIFMSFGNFKKTQQIMEDLSNKDKSKSSSLKDIATSKEEDSSYTYEGSDTANFGSCKLSSQTGTAQKIKTYVNNSAKKIRVDLFTYSNKFDDSDFRSVPDGEFIDAGIHEFRIGLKRTSGDGFIVGLESLSLNKYVGKKSKLEEVFLDMLGAFQITGGWSLAALFDGARGKISGSDATDNTYINVVVEVGKIIDFDDDEMKVVFQTSSANDNRTTYKAYSQVTYLIDCLGAAFYVDTEDTSETVYMDYE